jgi:hypothetical protein
MLIKERKVIMLDDLLDHWVGEAGNLVDYTVIAVYDTAGNKVSRAEELEIVYETLSEDGTAKDELTPDEQNDELRRLGF